MFYFLCNLLGRLAARFTDALRGLMRAAVCTLNSPALRKRTALLVLAARRAAYTTLQALKKAWGMRAMREAIAAGLGIAVLLAALAAAVPAMGNTANKVSETQTNVQAALCEDTRESVLPEDGSIPAEAPEQSSAFGTALKEATLIEDTQEPAKKEQPEENEDTGEYSEYEKRLIARVVYGESRGEPFEGQVAVAVVVINRYESGRFGSTVKKVVFAKNQFAIGSKYTDENMEAVEEAIAGADYPPTMFYFQRSTNKTWRNFIYYCRIGSHSFYLAAS